MGTNWKPAGAVSQQFSFLIFSCVCLFCFSIIATSFLVNKGENKAIAVNCTFLFIFIRVAIVKSTRDHQIGNWHVTCQHSSSSFSIADCDASEKSLVVPFAIRKRLPPTGAVCVLSPETSRPGEQKSSDLSPHARQQHQTPVCVRQQIGAKLFPAGVSWRRNP